MNRLPSHWIVSALMRAAYAQGGQAMLLARGAEERGGILLHCRSVPDGGFLLELAIDGTDRMFWHRIPQFSEDINDNQALVDAYIARRRAIDDDLWVLELSAANAHRLAVESIAVA